MSSGAMNWPLLDVDRLARSAAAAVQEIGLPAEERRDLQDVQDARGLRGLFAARGCRRSRAAPSSRLTSARMSRPSSSPGPRKEADRGAVGLVERRLEDDSRAGLLRRRREFSSAIARACWRDSMTQGPRRTAGGLPAADRVACGRSSILAGSSIRPAPSRPGSRRTPLFGLAVASASRLTAPQCARGADEVPEERVAGERLGLQLGMELAAEEPGMVVVQLDDLDELAVGRHAGEGQARVLQGRQDTPG